MAIETEIVISGEHLIELFKSGRTEDDDFSIVMDGDEWMQAANTIEHQCRN